MLYFEEDLVKPVALDFLYEFETATETLLRGFERAKLVTVTIWEGQLLRLESARLAPETLLRYVHRDAARHGLSGRCTAWFIRTLPGMVSSGRCPAWSSEALLRHGIFVLLFLLWYGIVKRPVNIQRGGGACEHSKRRWSMEGRRSQPLWCLEYLL